MTAHKHAALMLQYAQDAAETEKPWERWEYNSDRGWHQCEKHPAWFVCSEYRRKPEIIKVGRHEFPKPIGNIPEGATYYFVEFSFTTLSFVAQEDAWDGLRTDKGLLVANLCHLTREAAQAHAAVLNAICRGDIE